MAANHIALIFHDFSTGGSERIAIRLANAWAEAGRRVTIFCGTEAGASRALVSPHVTVKACSPEIPRGFGSRFRLGKRLRALISPDEPDVLFAPGNFHLSVLAVAGRTRSWKHPPFVCKLSNPILPSSRFGLVTCIASAVLRNLIAPVDYFTAMSPGLARAAGPLLGRGNLICIDEPILENYLPLSECIKTHDGAPIILCIGRLEAQKDFRLAISAFAELSPLTRAKLIILGEGPDRSALVSLARQLGVAERVEIPGHVPDVRPWLAKARLLLMTSRYEGYPAVLIEARAAGLPVISTNCSAAICEILPLAIHGEIVNSRKPAAIGGAIGRQLNQKRPDRLAISAGTERYSMERIAPEYLRLFDEIAG
jgi:glycosyltransferase involved in cell wall biosynthesis